MHRTHYFRRMVLIVLASLLAFGCKVMPQPPVIPMRSMPQVEMMKTYRPVSLGKIVIRVPRGKIIGGTYLDLNCYEEAKLKYLASGNVSIDPSTFEDVFREDMNSAGFTVAGDPNNLFAEDGLQDNQAEYIVGALVTEVEFHVCRPIYGWNFDSIKGWCHLKVNWQFFSSLEQRVVYDFTTEGVYSQEDRSDEVDEVDLWRNAFSSAVQNMMADSGFLKLISTQTTVNAPKQHFEVPIELKTPKLSSSPLSGHMLQAKDAAVMINIGHGSHGSGFFIDKRGYILTNRHVTGSAERISVEMPTGRKLIAEVLRSDPQRDIALLKVEDGAYPALPLQLKEPDIGSEVYAIGTPLMKELKFTVTKGIVSAYREYNGLPLIQSDVNIQGGNSGGPLLDEKGNVIAVCVIGYLNHEGQNFGANGFIPIKSALDTLNIKLK